MRRLFVASILVIAGLTACSNQSDTNSTNTSPDTTVGTPSIGGNIEWSSCEEGDDPQADTSLKCAQFEVPFDYNDTSIGSFSLTLVMRPAGNTDKRIGYMLANPGGPGFGGSYLAENAEAYFGGELVESFDIIGWDPRGTGESTPAIDCVDQYDPYFAYDPSPDDKAEEALIVKASKDFVTECEKKNSAIMPYISTNNSARDMDRIRAALGVDKISYFGFSYGSELGATWATMFPSTVRAAVLDGATDPNSDYIQGGLDQAKGFETELSKFLAQCSANPKCLFYNNGKAEQAFDDLMIALDKSPIPSRFERAPVNQGIALTAVAQAMYSSTLWEDLEDALNRAQNRDGTQLLRMYDEYYQRSWDDTYGNELEAFYSIMCLDDPGPQSVEEVDSYIPEFARVAPRLGSSFSAGYICTFWPTEPDRRVKITGKGAGPIIVVGTTGDAATPLQSSRNMAKALEDGRLVVVTENRHTGYGANDCVISAVNKYLLTTEVSWTEKQC